MQMMKTILSSFATWVVVVVLVSMAAAASFLIAASNNPVAAAQRYVLANEDRTTQFVTGIARSEHVLNGDSGAPDSSRIRCTSAYGDAWLMYFKGERDTILTLCKMSFDFRESTLTAKYYVRTDFPKATLRNFILYKQVKYVVQDEFLDVASLEANPGAWRVQPDLALGELGISNIARPPAIQR